MKVKVNTKELKNVLAIHKKILTGKINNFILTGVYFEANKCSLTVSSTDLERSLKSIIESEVISEGKCVVPFKIIDNIVNCCNDEYITLELNTELELIADKVKANTFSLDEYPAFPPLNPVNTLKLNYDDFIDSLNLIINSASKDESRVILTGILFDTVNNCICTTDSYRLSIADFYFNKDCGKFVIPGNLYPIFKELIKSKVKSFTIGVEENQIAFKIGNHVIVSRLLSGNYPEYEKLMPTDFNYQYEIESKDLNKVLDKCNKLFKSEAVPIKITFNTVKADTEMNVREIGNYQDNIPVKTIAKEKPYFKVISSTGNIDSRKFNTIQEAEEFVLNISDSLLPSNYDDAFTQEQYDNIEDYDVSIVKIIPDEITIAFNPEYLKDGIKYFDNPIINIVEPLKPALITQEDSKLKYLLMPIRVDY